MTCPRRMAQLLLIALALLTSIVVPLLARDRMLLLSAGGLVALAGGLVMLRCPPAGFALVIVASHFVPFEIGTGTQTGLNIVVLLLAALTAAWLFDQVLLRPRPTWFFAPTFLPLLLFAALSIFSFLVGQFRWFPVSGAPLRAQLGGLAIYLLSAAAYVVFALQIPSLAWLKRLTWIFLTMGAVFLFCTFYLGWLNPNWMNQIGFLFAKGTSGSVFWIWMTVLALGQLLFHRSLHWLAKTALLLLLFAIGYYRGLTTIDWTSGWLPALAGAIALVLLVDARLSAGLVIAGLVVLPLVGPAFYERLILASNEYSVLTRMEAARILFEIIKTSPVFGLGPANYYWYTPLYSILGYFVPFNSHNNYLDLLAQTGIVSVVLFGWFLVRVTAQGVRLFRQAQPGFIKAYSAACLAAVPALLVSAMLGDWVIPFPYNIGMSGMRSSFFTFLFLGGLAVIEYRHLRLPFSRESAPPAAPGVPR